MKKERVRGKNIQRYMLWTYFAMACISVFIEIILCIYMVNSIKKQVEQIHAIEQKQIVAQMDQSMAVLEEQISQLSQNNLVRQILNLQAKPQYHGEDVLILQKLITQLADTQDYYSEISQILLLDK